MADTLVNHKLDRVRNDLQHPKSPQTLGSYAPASNTTTDTLSIHVPELGDDDHEPPKISNFEFVASYNWLDESTPTILVPGQP